MFKGELFIKRMMRQMFISFYKIAEIHGRNKVYKKIC